MCRIAGIVNPQVTQTALEAQVKEMCSLLKHGGPDDEGIYSDAKNYLVLGHRRLALIDLSPAGHQPMIFEKRFVISFNGEIYNFPELKKELEALGQHFHTHSDTEVILAAFAQWHTQSFARLKGMFAFALLDKQTQTLYLVRDPSGIKPLYYSIENNALVFASEIRAFYAAGKATANRNWPVFQLAYGHIPEPVTTLEGVRPLHKGCFLAYDLKQGLQSLQSFAHYSFGNKDQDAVTAALNIQQSIRDAVKSHLLSDAPIGVFLSGGIDSSIISLAAAEASNTQLNTLSLYFDDAHFSEKKYQDILIQQLRCAHYQHLLQAEEFEQALPVILQDMDMPSCDGINTWFISKYAAAQGLKAVLSGIGGDELFGGYPSFNRMRATLALQHTPDLLLKAGRSSSLKRIKRLQYLQLDGIKGCYLFLRGQYVPAEIAKRLDSTEKEIWDILETTPVFGELNSLAAKDEASWMEMNCYMQNQLLRDADIMSMAHGIEIRVPMLDDTVIKNALHIPAAVKYSGQVPKQLLINAFIDQLPEATWNRPKMGFAFPFQQWLDNSAFVKELLSAAGKNTRDSYADFKKGALHWSHLMSLIILQTRGIA